MNLKEGTRRLALLLGVVGAMCCALLSYFALEDALHQRTEHFRFANMASRIEQLGRQTQSEYPVYRDIDSGELGWKMLDKYPQYWDWITGQSMQVPAVPKPWEIHDAEQALPKTRSWEDVPYDWRISGIKTPAGQIVYPTPEPGMGAYFLIVILPFLGFFLPWCSVRSIGWVSAGFIERDTRRDAA